MIGVSILNFPAKAKNLGIFNGFLSTAIIVFLVAKSLENLVKAIPLSLMN
jgi:amino acid permease